MHITFLDARQADQQIRTLVKRSRTFSFAVAWAASNNVRMFLQENQRKISKAVIGTHFFRTDPDILSDFEGSSKVRINVDHAGGVFHPKCYLFSMNNGITNAIVGSSNFTHGGLSNNTEANLLITAKNTEAAIEEIRSLVENSWLTARQIDADYLSLYKANYSRFQAVTERSVQAMKSTIRLRRLPQGASLTWDQFANACRHDLHGSFEERLFLLSEAQRMFAKARNYYDLRLGERCALAGLHVINDEELDQTNWGWFGSMAGAGIFAEQVHANSRRISNALKQIPSRGAVNREDYENFVEEFVSAFEGRQRAGGISTGTRLLAMKRPDTFLCISKPNKRALAVALDFAPTTLSLSNYWDRVIEPIRAATWYTSQRPTGDDAELWDVRAAMLDALYYEP